MAFGLYEYPHTNLQDSDLSEMLALYRKLVADYNAIVEEIRKAREQYENSEELVESWKIDMLNRIYILGSQMREYIKSLNDVQTEIIDRFETIRRNTQEYIRVGLEEMDRLLKSGLKDVSDIESRILNSFKNNKNILMDIVEEFKESNSALTNNITTSVNALVNDTRDMYEERTNELTELIEEQHAWSDGYKKWFQKEETVLLKRIEATTNTVKSEVLKEARLQTSNTLARFKNDSYVPLAETVDELHDEIEVLRGAVNSVKISDFNVVDPTNGKEELLQTALGNMWNFWGAWSIPADVFDALGLTAEQFDEWQTEGGILPIRHGITAIELDMCGRWFLCEKRDFIEEVLRKVGA